MTLATIPRPRMAYEPAFVWAMEGYHAEKPYAIHRRGGRKRAGEFTQGMGRILDEKFVRWVRAWDDETGDWRKDAEGHAVYIPAPRPSAPEDPDQWAMPVHEALKRLRGRKRPYRIEWYWLRETLRWRGLPCPCNHVDVIDHLAAQAGVSPKRVEAAVMAAARELARIVGIERDPSAPVALLPRRRRRNQFVQRTFDPEEIAS